MKRLMLIVVAAAALIAAKQRGDSYVLADEGNTVFMGGMNIREWVALREAYPGNLLWVRRNGRDYLIRDETTLLRARALFAPQQALQPDINAVAREEEKLDREADHLSDEAPRTEANRQRLAEIRAKLRDVRRRERELDNRSEELERKAERELWELVDTAIQNGMARRLTR